jgi:hypothetical protein
MTKNIQRFTLLTLALFVVSSTAISGNADDVPPGEHSNVVRITVGTQHFCTGTLISPGIVLAASHCFFDVNVQPHLLRIFKVHFSDGTTSGIVNYRVNDDHLYRENIIQHLFDGTHIKDYVRNIARGESTSLYRGDIALVYLNKCITHIEPVRLPTRAGDDHVCQIGDIVGYGNTNSQATWNTGNTEEVTTKVARKAQVLIHSGHACEQVPALLIMARLARDKLYARALRLFPGLNQKVYRYVKREVRKVQTLQGKPVLCNAPVDKRLALIGGGDSGGPLFVNGVQVGVVSQVGGIFGEGAGFVAYHTRVDFYLDWIKKYAIDVCSHASSPRRLRRVQRGRRLRFEFQQKTLLQMNDKIVFGVMRSMKRFDQCTSEIGEF